MLTPQEWETLVDALPEYAITKAHVENARPDLEAALRPVLARVWAEGRDSGHQEARAVNPEWPAPPPNPYEES